MPQYSNLCFFNILSVAFFKYLSHLYTFSCKTLLSILLFHKKNFAKAPLADLLLHDVPLLVKVVRGERFHPGFVLRSWFCTKIWSSLRLWYSLCTFTVYAAHTAIQFFCWHILGWIGSILWTNQGTRPYQQNTILQGRVLSCETTEHYRLT